MTQPAGDPPPSGGGVSTTLVTATAITLALIAVEARVKEDVDEAITAALTAYAALLVVALASPLLLISTGTALLSTPAVHAGLVGNLTAAENAARMSINSGYTAATQIARSKVAADLAAQDYTVGEQLPELGTTPATLNTDLDTMFGHAQTDIANTVRAAYDGVQGDDPDAARTVAVNNAVRTAGARLRQRGQAAASTAVYQGATDAQQALFAQYQNTTGNRLLKRWVTTSADPCGMCRALNGTVVAVNAEFDHDATTDDKDLRRVWRTLYGPPRHPHCRCQLQLITT